MSDIEKTFGVVIHEATILPDNYNDYNGFLYNLIMSEEFAIVLIDFINVRNIRSIIMKESWEKNYDDRPYFFDSSICDEVLNKFTDFQILSKYDEEVIIDILAETNLFDELVKSKMFKVMLEQFFIKHPYFLSFNLSDDSLAKRIRSFIIDKLYENRIRWVNFIIRTELIKNLEGGWRGFIHNIDYFNAILYMWKKYKIIQIWNKQTVCENKLWVICKEIKILSYIFRFKSWEFFFIWVDHRDNSNIIMWLDRHILLRVKSDIKITSWLIANHDVVTLDWFYMKWDLKVCFRIDWNS